MAPGRRFGRRLRPTSDRAREALFNIIRAHVAEARVLDLFAGTGALGLEALSRGAKAVVFVDAQKDAIDLIRNNIALCGFSDAAVVLQRDIARGLSFLKGPAPGAGFDLVFMDPPYGLGLGEKLLAELTDMGILKADALVVAEAGAGEDLPARAGELRCTDRRCYGAVGFWIYRQGEGENDERL